MKSVACWNSRMLYWKPFHICRAGCHPQTLLWQQVICQAPLENWLEAAEDCQLPL
jgi:hypothetical protein